MIASRIQTLPESIRRQLARFDPARLASPVHTLGPKIMLALRSDPQVKAALNRIESHGRYREEVGFRWRALQAQQAAAANDAKEPVR